MTSRGTWFSTHNAWKGTIMLLEENGKTLDAWFDKSTRSAARNAMLRTEHKMIATTHILLGMLGEHSGAKSLLEIFGLKQDRVRKIVADMEKPRPQGLGSGFLFTDGAMSVLSTAQKLAQEYDFREGQQYTDYLLLALVQDAGGGFKVIDADLEHVMKVCHVPCTVLREYAVDLLESTGTLVKP